jgi:hypothetical protein
MTRVARALLAPSDPVQPQILGLRSGATVHRCAVEHLVHSSALVYQRARPVRDRPVGDAQRRARGGPFRVHIPPEFANSPHELVRARVRAVRAPTDARFPQCAIPMIGRRDSHGRCGRIVDARPNPRADKGFCPGKEANSSRERACTHGPRRAPTASPRSLHAAARRGPRCGTLPTPERADPSVSDAPARRSPHPAGRPRSTGAPEGRKDDDDAAWPGHAVGVAEARAPWTGPYGDPARPERPQPSVPHVLETTNSRLPSYRKSSRLRP